ncbi:hypothetical protein Hs30E_01690 [Lactococcus hodotermopsidis]|uniref:PASTA domain-containing protein n=1 Tax=Pseudolactococcus hodotermopsidis TaxID=2709157 RepID=A0A6A0BAX8_9LACT|nr:PASTA domain-containing protein [Lactococcus hodotermopsidis]GFH41618.1 hypothetical protein Hs30E_01690 [Lactococcus hodotermopsidis]
MTTFRKQEKHFFKTLWHYFGRFALFIALAAAIGAGTAIYIFFDSSKNLIVPDVEGLSKIDASNKLTTVGFKKISYKFTTYDGESNIALKTSPEAGSAAKNLGNIVIYISEFKGVDIPDYQGKMADSSLNQLREDYKLTDKNLKITRQYSSKKAGTILNKTTFKNFNSHSDILKITISDGKDAFLMSDWVNKSLTEARDKLIEMGVAAEKIKVNYENSTVVDIGKIIRQTPEKNDNYSLQSPEDISFTVSSGSVLRTVAFPSLIGMSYDNALQTLNAMGYPLDHITYSGVKTTIVKEQTIAPDTMVMMDNSFVTLIMESPKAYEKAIDQIDPKSLVNMDSSAAFKTLKDLGIDFRVSFDNKSSLASGRIISATVNNDMLLLKISSRFDDSKSSSSSSSSSH